MLGKAVPKKKELSQKQIDHLNAIRGKASERKREIKLKKHEEYKKQAMEKKVQQIELKGEPIKNEPIKQEPNTRCDAVTSSRQEEQKQKKKTIKKIIKYVEADEDDEDEEEEIIITKPKKKEKEKQIEPQNIKQPELSYSDLLYQSSLERIQTKMMNERAKNIIYSVIPNYYELVLILHPNLI